MTVIFGSRRLRMNDRNLLVLWWGSIGLSRGPAEGDPISTASLLTRLVFALWLAGTKIKLGLVLSIAPMLHRMPSRFWVSGDEIPPQHPQRGHQRHRAVHRSEFAALVPDPNHHAARDFDHH